MRVRRVEANHAVFGANRGHLHADGKNRCWRCVTDVPLLTASRVREYSTIRISALHQLKVTRTPAGPLGRIPLMLCGSPTMA
jgi:hypothetical protein